MNHDIPVASDSKSTTVILRERQRPKDLPITGARQHALNSPARLSRFWQIFRPLSWTATLSIGDSDIVAVNNLRLGGLCQGRHHRSLPPWSDDHNQMRLKENIGRVKRVTSPWPSPRPKLTPCNFGLSDARSVFTCFLRPIQFVVVHFWC